MIESRGQGRARRASRLREPRAATAPSGSDLARLWADGSVFIAHQAGCACMGGSFASIDPTALAQDILEYLQARYANGASPSLSRFVEEAAQAAHTFASWLESLDEAPLEPADKARLLGDLSVTLQSIRTPAAGFQCI